MPFDTTRALPEQTTPGIGDYDKPAPSYMDTLSAAFRQDNLIASTFSNARGNYSREQLMAIDPAYNVFHDPDLKGYVADNPERFEDVYNKSMADAIRANIDKEKTDRATLAASAWVPWLTGELAANVLDPTILLPGGALGQEAKVGFKVGRSALSLAVASGVSTAVQEAGLQATQETRPLSDSISAVGGSVLLGGLLGAGASKFLSNAEWSRVSKSLEESLAGETPDPVALTDTIVKRMQAAGAQSVDQIKLDDLDIGQFQGYEVFGKDDFLKNKIGEAVAKATAAARINPGIQTMLSPSKTVREVYNKLTDNPIYTKMNMEGETLGPAVENLVKMYERGALADWLGSTRDLYRQAKKAGYEGTKADFYDAITMAGRRGDVDINGNEFITKAAQEARSKIYDPLLVRAKEAGLLPEDVHVTTAASYVTRLWNRTRLIGEEARFKQIARQYFDEQISKIQAMQEAGKEAPKTPDFVSATDRKDYIDQVVNSVYDNLIGRGHGDVPDWIVPAKQGPLKERTFNIPDAKVEDFLENDAEVVMRRYVRKMAPEVEIATKFGRPDMKDQFDAIKAEYDDLRKAAKTDKERTKLIETEKRDIANLSAFRDLIRGTYRAAEEGSDWSKITRAALTWNYLRLLGGVTLASLTDASRLVAVHGVRATMREALPALVKNIKAAQISRQDAKDLGAVVERVLQSRLASLSEINDPYAHGSAFERFMSNTSNVFSKATGLGWWNDTLKTMASVMTQNRMMGNALNWSGADKAEKAYMAYLGINEDMAQRIAAQFKKHGMQEDGIYGANVGAWDDEIAARAWAAALNKDVDRTIISPGVADRPLWMRTNWGKLIMQFKSFSLASHQRVLIAGLQERPHRFAEQLVGATALGMLISWLKYKERGDDDEAAKLVENPGNWVANGLDRSGIFSIPFDITNTLDKVSSSMGGRNISFAYAASKLAGDPSSQGQIARYASRDPIGAVLGPTAGIFSDLATIAAQLSQGDLKKSGANAMIRQLPGATLPGIRSAIHIGIKPALGAQ
jgi:hypothetical protein